MEYRQLGSTGIRVSRLGFGAWGLGGDAYGPVDDQESLKAVGRAVDRGINFFDTADVYGNGHSEEILGEALADVRKDMVLATKGGTLPHRGFVMPQDFSASHLSRALEKSLERLRTDYVDLYQLHSPDLSDLAGRDDFLDALHRFKSDGRVRALGISTRSPDDALRAIGDYDFDVIQVNFNMIDQRARDCGLLDLAAERGVGIIARTPLCFGYLSGKLPADADLAETDHRRNWPRDQLERWARAPHLFRHLYGREGQSATRLALRFCMAHEGVSTVIPGMMNVDEVDENVGAMEIPPLSVEELADIRRIYQENTFYDKTAKSRGTA